ncbi:hypothetical protein QBC43DRAFT_357547 [Cladorrhinum sp. PSN259]|nr:hypothetical protein QBC43DRAFT_357547 [Cladorrhinum sp. PSN259]
MMVPVIERDLREVLVAATSGRFAGLYRRYRLLLEYLAASTPSANPDGIPTKEELSAQWGKARSDDMVNEILVLERDTHFLANMLEAKMGTPTDTPFPDITQVLHDTIYAKPMQPADPKTPVCFFRPGIGNNLRLNRRVHDYIRHITLLEELMEDSMSLRRGTIGIMGKKPLDDDDPHVLGWRLDGSLAPDEEDDQGVEQPPIGPLGGFEEGTPLKESSPEHHTGIIKLKVFFTLGEYTTCTGWLLNGETVITASSNLYRPGKGFARTVHAITPDRYATIQATHATVYWHWFKSLGLSDGAAAIRLDQEYLNAKPLNFSFLQSCAATELPVTMRGFIGQTAVQQYDKDRMYEAETTFITDLEETEGVVVHDISTGPATPGSPFINEGGWVVAMHYGRERVFCGGDFSEREERVAKTSICAVHFDRYLCNPKDLKSVLDFMQGPTYMEVAGIVTKPIKLVGMPGRACRFAIELLLG